jgi:hypothetical protein
LTLAEQIHELLSHNPFSKPAILATPKKTEEPEQGDGEETKLELTATLVSDVLPMVIVGGELLSIGEEISGYRLIAVDEGNASFLKNGKAFVIWLLGSGVEIEE